MTDRELLELAARAAGLIPNEFAGNSHFMDGVLEMWCPLTDDGDALRLAVDLRLIKNSHQWLDEFAGHAATRRAIVRAAAEIGKGKQ